MSKKLEIRAKNYVRAANFIWTLKYESFKLFFLSNVNLELCENNRREPL